MNDMEKTYQEEKTKWKAFFSAWKEEFGDDIKSLLGRSAGPMFKRRGRIPFALQGVSAIYLVREALGPLVEEGIEVPDELWEKLFDLYTEFAVCRRDAENDRRHKEEKVSKVMGQALKGRVDVSQLETDLAFG